MGISFGFALSATCTHPALSPPPLAAGVSHEGRGRGVIAAWEGGQGRHCCVTGAWEGRYRCGGGVSGASPLRERGVIAAWNWRFQVVRVDVLWFVRVEVLFLVGGVTVDSVEELCLLVNPLEAK